MASLNFPLSIPPVHLAPSFPCYFVLLSFPPPSFPKVIYFLFFFPSVSFPIPPLPPPPPPPLVVFPPRPVLLSLFLFPHIPLPLPRPFPPCHFRSPPVYMPLCTTVCFSLCAPPHSQNRQLLNSEIRRKEDNCVFASLHPTTSSTKQTDEKQLYIYLYVTQ